MKPRYLILLLILIGIAQATYIQEPLLTKPSNSAGWITIDIGYYNGTNDNDVVVDANYVMLNETVKINASANVTIGNLSESGDTHNFTVTPTTSATINVSVKGQYAWSNYSVYSNGVYSKKVSNATGWIDLTEAISAQTNYSFSRAAGIPVLLTPANLSAQAITTLPYSQSFTWSNEGSPRYQIQIATDSGFSNKESDTTVTTNSAFIGMWNAGVHYWRVRNYDGGSVYGDWSEIFSFTLTGTSLPSSDGSTGIQGIVYEVRLTGNLPIPSAQVQISNLTWTSSTTSDINGYYRFTGLTNNSLYSLKATAKNYNDGSVELVTTSNGTWAIKNLYLTACVSSFTCNVNQQFITFIVQNLWWTKYSNVLSTVYKGTDLTQPFVYQSSTGKDGSTNFWLVKDQQYTITFINASQGISITWTGYPPLSGYQYIITSASSSGSYTNNTDQLAAITILVSSNVTNSTSANIYANYSDSLAQTSSLLFTLNTSIPGDPNNQTQLQIINGGSNSIYNATFTVNNYQGQGYLIKIAANHQTFGAISYSYIIQFPVSTPLSSFNPISVLMMLVGLILFVAGFFGQTSTEQGSGVIVGLVWLFSGVGLFSNINLGANFYLGLTLATVVAVIQNINARARREGIT